MGRLSEEESNLGKQGLAESSSTFWKMGFEFRYEGGERVGIAEIRRKEEQLKALPPMVLRRAGGTVRWIEEEDQRHRDEVTTWRRSESVVSRAWRRYQETGQYIRRCGRGRKEGNNPAARPLPPPLCKEGTGGALPEPCKMTSSRPQMCMCLLKRYRDEILRPLVRPYAGAVGPGFLLMQDNARPHVAGVCQQFLQDEGIDAMDWPARSPDLNPIEHIWDIMSRSIHQRHVAPQTVQELADALVQTMQMYSPVSLSVGYFRIRLRSPSL
ncbi:hypothetical protein L3Q82_003876 [Scortum barcoo]|uniref:Uncharacterized protein n=1 Tax=Scortum barcoo TaxID=214431 RepID=A0ACB8X757_9TELE|nr:hypothetical protein L3Q82_003876 [Scortum barcoo]